MLRAHVPLRAVFVRNIPQPHRHHKTRQRRANGPVRIHAVPIVLVASREVNEPAFSLRPGGGLAFARLVGAKCLGEDDVDEPAGVEGFEGPDEQHFDDVAEGAGVQVGDQSVQTAVGGLEALFGVGEAALEFGADAAEEIVVCVRRVVCEGPDARFDEEEGEGEDDVDEVAPCATPEADGRGEPW